MNRITRMALLVAVLCVPPCLVATGQTGAVPSRRSLPPSVAALVPAGAKVESSDAVHSAMNETMGFHARKTFPNSNDQITYSVSITCYEPKMWKTLKSSYQTMVTQSLESLRRSMARTVDADPPNMISHPWGGGVVQRTQTKQANVIDGPKVKTDPYVIGYDCHYYGITGSSLFECRVQGGGSPGNMASVAADADRLAERVAGEAAKVSYGILNQ